MVIMATGGLLSFSFSPEAIGVRRARVDFNAPWFGCVIVLVASFALARVGWALNHRRPIAQDSAGNNVTHKPFHALMWIPVEYWSLITLAYGLYAVLS